MAGENCGEWFVVRLSLTNVVEVRCEEVAKVMYECYRYVWSDRNGKPLRQIQASSV